ncbi:TonB-dependent receptor [Sphingobacterium arenae]|uniref:TonB-dependent receptor n=1 Tax=Sphingobacterium arenae TaxID=1280598 RepID=A0ABR7Y545_9SPHI|nr:TonB-dependent receptor [Sphingobacterium arenae]MBD1426414.1 TonB-dependent receptor [Sphingobacterium arenae]
MGWSATLYAQTGTINGIVVDAGDEPLAKATVSIVSATDSTVLSYTLSDDRGRFDLVRIPARSELLLYITHINSEPYRQKVTLEPKEKRNLDTIRMAGQQLDEVVVNHVAPIRLNGDTLEYKADYFKTRPNANVEELLQLLPGLQVNVDGTIYYQGRQVSGIRVNNKDFFAQDITLATRNLDASLVDVVQVIKDKGESKREILDDTDLPIVINLKTKKEFVKADFGKFYGSGGTRERYEAGALVNTFRDTLQISFIGYGNNISRQGFDYSELRQYGGMARAEAGGTSYYTYGGLQHKISLGINANYDIGKKLKTNLMYTFEKQDDITESNGSSTSFYDAITEFSANQNSGTHINNSHKIRTFIRYRPDTTTMVSLDGTIDFRQNTNDSWYTVNTTRESSNPVQDGESESGSTNHHTNFRYNLYGEKKFGHANILLSFRQTGNRQESTNRNHNNSWNHYYLFNDSTVDQSTLRYSNGKTADINNHVNIQIPVRKQINWDWYARYNWQQNQNLEDIDNRINVAEYTNRNDVANNKQGTFDFTYVGTKLNASIFNKKVKLSAGTEWLSLGRRYHYYDQTADLKDRRYYWLPNASVTYAGITASYNKSVQLPGFYAIVAVNSDLRPTSITLASPYFDNQMEQSMQLRYQKNFSKINLSLSSSISYSRYDNSIGYQRTYDIENSQSTNGQYQTTGNDRIYMYGHLSKRFATKKDWQISMNLNGYGSISSSYSMVNGEENKGNRSYGNIQSNINLSYKNNITLIPTYSIGISGTRYAWPSENFRDISNIRHSIGTGFRVDNLAKFRLETSYTLQNQPQSLRKDRTNLHVVNASLYYPLLQRKGELKFTAFDILNQNQNVNLGSSGNANYYSEQLTLRQYFMLGLVFKFLATPNK